MQWGGAGEPETGSGLHSANPLGTACSSISCIFAETSSLQIALSHPITSGLRVAACAPSLEPPRLLPLSLCMSLRSAFPVPRANLSLCRGLSLVCLGTVPSSCPLFYLGFICESPLPRPFSRKLVVKEEGKKGWHGLQFKECLFLRDSCLVPPKARGPPRRPEDEGAKYSRRRREQACRKGISVSFPHCRISMQMRCKTPYTQVPVILRRALWKLGCRFQSQATKMGLHGAAPSPILMTARFPSALINAINIYLAPTVC